MRRVQEVAEGKQSFSQRPLRFSAISAIKIKNKKMQKILLPENKDWKSLITRPTAEKASLNELVNTVFNEVKENGDKAVFQYCKTFDKVDLTNLTVSEDDVKNASSQLSDELKAAIQLAKNNIGKFHKAQKQPIEKIETTKGVFCWRENRAIESVGIYIPGGSAPLFSTVLMLGIPAMLAGCKEIILCTPPNNEGKINPAILYTAALVGITKIYSIGGIQAIAAMTFGTETISAVNKIFGPGNQYVTAAKQMAQNFGVAIDMPAGPSEVLVIADKTCNPVFVAADLLSQAEHGADSQVILLSNNEDVINDTLIEITKQLQALPRKNIATKAIENSKAILLNDIEECIALSNLYAPEHLIIAVENSNTIVSQITNAGSIFLGNYSCESVGDYTSGTNHTLPTNGYARNYSGVSLDSFVKKITVQQLSKEGLQNIGPSVELMAEAEGLWAHKNAVSVRLAKLF
jgi:histidinol dehydrogenase